MEVESGRTRELVGKRRIGWGLGVGGNVESIVGANGVIIEIRKGNERHRFSKSVSLMMIINTQVCCQIYVGSSYLYFRH